MACAANICRGWSAWKGTEELYGKSEAIVRVSRGEGINFDMTVRLTQRYVMAPWMFNLFMDGVLSEWKASILNAGVCLNGRDGGQCGVSSLLFEDGEVLHTDGEYACRGRWMKLEWCMKEGSSRQM